MHARRYFVKALDAGDKRAALPLAAYKKLYEIEAEIRDRDPDAKLVERRARSKLVWVGAEPLPAFDRHRIPHDGRIVSTLLLTGAQSPVGWGRTTWSGIPDSNRRPSAWEISGTAKRHTDFT
jgi:hypothetical protein